MLKVCKKCREEKLISEFSFKRPTGRKPGFQPRCKSCCIEDTKQWRLEQSPDRLKDLYLQRTYKITLQEYQSILKKQNNKCLLCTRDFNFTTIDGPGLFPDSPVVDHCHSKGHVRGLLCNECNRGLGYFHDNIKTLENAIIYLKDD